MVLAKAKDFIFSMDKHHKQYLKRFLYEQNKYDWKFKLLRKMILKEQKVCQYCGNCKFLELHHKSGFINEPDNLILVCHSCHEKLEGKNFPNVYEFQKK